MEAAIRGALEKAGIPGARARERIYDSARSALDRSLERQGVSDGERIAAHQARLEDLIAAIESEWTPPADISPAGAAGAGIAPEVSSGDVAPATPADVWTVDPEPKGPAGEAAPVVAATRSESPAEATSGGDARLDFAPPAGETANAPPPIAAEPAERQRLPAAKQARRSKKVKLPKAKPEKRRRPIFAAMFSGAVMLSFLGIGVWWLIESGALTTADQRDTGVPNPPPSLTRDDFAGGPQQLNPGSGFTGEWANVYTPGRDGSPVIGDGASAEVIEQTGGNVLRIVSRSKDQNGEVRIPLGAEVMQALAGRQSALAISVRSASSETTQIYVKCEFSVLGDCGRRRFDVTYETSDLLFSLDFDRALAPNEAGYLVINSDITGDGKGIDLLAVRIRPIS
jgi:hypothetical protein